MIDRFVGRYCVLSNFYPTRVWLDGERYTSVEYAYQAAKTLDPKWRQMVREAPTPATAKHLGRQLPLRLDWGQIKLDVMLDLLRQKFAEQFRGGCLRATGNQPLIEGNSWHDNYWGSCFCAKCGNCGENHLGKLLMQVRAELRATEGEAP